MKKILALMMSIVLVFMVFVPELDVEASVPLQLITPVAAGLATGSLYFPMETAFDGQPVLDANGNPTGGVGPNNAPIYAGRHGYIDFGENWQNIRITSTWTQYRVSSVGDMTPYAELWWDDDSDTVNDSGLNETTFNFNTATGLSTGSTTPWIKDSDMSGNPVTPKGRYLICHTPQTFVTRAKEYAIVGWIYTGNEVLQIFTPTAAGQATGSLFFPLERAFDGQPAFDENTGVPSGGAGVNDAPYYAGRVGYIDFGPDWQKVKITSTWTQYRVSSAGSMTPFAELWWDDDYDTVNDSGFTETCINFNTAQNLSTGSTTPWILDDDVISNPVTPRGRYLLCRAPATFVTRAKEYALIAWIDENGNGIQEAPFRQVTGITVTSVGGQNSVLEGETLQMTAAVVPYVATNKSYTWSVVNGTGAATINSRGLLTGVSDGAVTVKAISQDGSGVIGTMVVQVSRYRQFILPVQGMSGIYYPDIQASFPQINWQTLERLYIPAGTYNYMKIDHLPVRTADNPLIITNYGGQVHVTGTHTYTVTLGGGANWIFTGKYDPVNKTGDIHYPGHAGGNYANSTGTYGIHIGPSNTTGLLVGNFATNFELEYFEIGFGGFAGLMLKTDNQPSATMDQVKVHDLYIHDSESEGMYIGSTQNIELQHKLNNLEIYNNRVIRSGTEGIQLGNTGDGLKVHNNVVVMSAIDWKDPFQLWQDGGLQLSHRSGNADVYNNIFIGGAGSLMQPWFSAASNEATNPNDEVHIYNNYFSHSRNIFSYIHDTPSNYATQFRFEDNIIRQMNFQYDEINPNNVDLNRIFYASDNTHNLLFFNDNVRDGSQVFIDSLGGNNGTSGNVSASGNVTVADIDPVVFMDDTFPADFDWSRVEIWDDYSELYGVPIYYQQGDYVYYYETGALYECIQPGTHTGINPTTAPATWRLCSPMTDDFRLDPSSLYQSMGLLD